MDKPVSERINEVIAESGMSYREVSKATGIPYSTIQRYATGHTEKIPIPAVQMIARATRTTAEYILGWEEKPLHSYQVESSQQLDIVERMGDDELFRKAVDVLYNMNKEQLEGFMKLFG